MKDTLLTVLALHLVYSVEICKIAVLRLRVIHNVATRAESQNWLGFLTF